MIPVTNSQAVSLRHTLHALQGYTRLVRLQSWTTGNYSTGDLHLDSLFCGGVNYVSQPPAGSFDWQVRGGPRHCLLHKCKHGRLMGRLHPYEGRDKDMLLAKRFAAVFRLMLTFPMVFIVVSGYSVE